MPAPPELDGLMAFLGETFRRPDPIPGAGGAVEAGCAEHVTGNSRLTPAEQVDIYRRQYFLRHVDSLADDYPGTQYLLGEEAFEAFCRAYLLAHPPRRFTLRDLGEDIVPFAEGYPLAEDRRAVALEMLRYEHAFVDLFDGPDAPPMDAQKLASIPEDAWERARIVLHPLLVRMRVAYPVHRLRLAARSGEAAPLEGPPERREANLVLFRGNETIRFEELDESAFALLDALARGEPLGPACEEIAATLPPEAALALGGQVGAWFQEWTALRWIVDVEV